MRRPVLGSGGAREVDLGEWAGTARKRGRPKTQRRERVRLLEEAGDMMRSADWSAATPAHLVPLYALCHERVYGVAPAEMDDPAQHAMAVQAARLAVKRDHGGDVVAAVEFIRWVWKREAYRESKADGDGRGRIGWRLQFSPGLVTDWRVDLARRAARGR